MLVKQDTEISKSLYLKEKSTNTFYILQNSIKIAHFAFDASKKKPKFCGVFFFFFAKQANTVVIQTVYKLQGTKPD